MTEFAFSGVGINPHYGTPGNPADRKRVPGGSSSGAARGGGRRHVRDRHRQRHRRLGAHSGRALRPRRLQAEPAAHFRPPAPFRCRKASIRSGRSRSTVADCAKADAVMAGDDFKPLEPAPLADLRIGIAQGMPLENLDDTVAKRFPRSASTGWNRPARGCPTKSCRCSTAWMRVNARGGVQPAEAFTVHRDRLDRRGDDIDPNVRMRLERARNIAAADYIEMVNERAGLIAGHGCAACRYRRAGDADHADRRAAPSTKWRRRTISARKNALLLRNTSIVEFLRSAAPSRCRCRARAACRPA